MMREPEIVFIAGIFNDFSNAWIVKFHHNTIGNIDQMVMLHGGVCFLKLGDVLPKLVFYNEFTIEQKVDGIVKRCAAHPVIVILH